MGSNAVLPWPQMQFFPRPKSHLVLGPNIVWSWAKIYSGPEPICLLCVSYLIDLSQIVTNIRKIILQTTRVWWKEVGFCYGIPKYFLECFLEWSMGALLGYLPNVPKLYHWSIIRMSHGYTTRTLFKFSESVLLYWNTLRTLTNID